MDDFDVRAHLSLSTLMTNEGQSELGIHHDPPCPLPALVAGPTVFRWDPVSGGWHAAAAGGSFLLVDGMFNLSYGPRDVLLVNGNYLHGVTGLRDVPGAGQVSRPELQRFSSILFNTWERAKGMMKTDNFGQDWTARWAISMPRLTPIVPRHQQPVEAKRERIPKRRFDVEG